MNRYIKILLLLFIVIGFLYSVYFYYFQKNIHSSQKDVYVYSLDVATTTLEQKHTEISFVGDIMLSRFVKTKIERQNNPYFPFHNVKDILSASDVTVGNLESPFRKNGRHDLLGITFSADYYDIKRLEDSGFDVLSLANNHALDGGENGLLFTKNVLASSSIVGVGIGNDCHEGEVIIKNGIRFRFLSYSYTGYNDGGYNPHELVCDYEDRLRVLEDINDLKEKSDVIIVLVHAGVEDSLSPKQKEESRYKEMIDSGADLVIGTHPHVLQKIEKYNNGLIAYSLGNFVFDQLEERQKKSVILTVSFKNQEIIEYKTTPIIIENLCCPKIVDDSSVRSTSSKK